MLQEGVPIWTSLAASWDEDGGLQLGAPDGEETGRMILQRFPEPFYRIPPSPVVAMDIGFALIEGPFQLELFDLSLTIANSLKLGECYPTILEPENPAEFCLFIELLLIDVHKFGELDKTIYISQDL